MSRAPVILVTGATGRVGRHVVSGLLRAGAHVRALTRNPDAAGLPREAEVFRGDLADPPSLARALRGAERLYLFPHPQTAREVTAMAREAGVRRTVVLSGALADDEPDDHRGYRPVEEAARSSGMDWTLVRPGEFAANWLDHAEAVRTRREVRRPFAAAVTRPVHEADTAAVAVEALLGGGHAGAAYTFGGPEELTAVEQVAAIADAIGERIRFTELTPEQTRREWHDPEQGVTREVIDWLLDLYGSAASTSDRTGGAAAIRQVTGRPPRTFAQWARDHADAFR
ncbi:NAD(P)H-binding protein [Nocardiopsis potens]|uniref:NAD(P)H-binding protein n=1 Tax=Nocardiopsis potens TaxID=1246458 RepID=UPI00034990C0|nr:NAD(P)H-binding protein [Nocardiopsis potens]